MNDARLIRPDPATRTEKLIFLSNEGYISYTRNRIFTMRFALLAFGWFRQFHVFFIRVWLRHFLCTPMTFSEGSVLIVAPHQDDETLGCGGLIALKRAVGVTVRVVFLTDGSAAASPTLPTARKNFVQTRRREALMALHILGVGSTSVTFLDIPDATLRDVQSSEIAINHLAAILNANPPEEVYTPHSHDCHPDHEAAWRITQAAVQRAGLKVDLIQYAIWMLWSAPLFFRLFPWHLAGARQLCIRSVQAKKQRAIAAYTSQCTTLPRGFLGQFLGPEEIFFFQNDT